MIHAGLRVERNESKRLGSELVGDDLRRDVEQVVVDFRNHRFAAISDDESTTRWELKKRGFDTLIQTTLQRLVAERKRRDELAQENQLLRRKLQALTDGRWGLESVFEQAESKPADTAAVEKRIAQIEAELGRIKPKPVSPDDHLAVVVATLGEPQEHLRMDVMGVVPILGIFPQF